MLFIDGKYREQHPQLMQHIHHMHPDQKGGMGQLFKKKHETINKLMQQ